MDSAVSSSPILVRVGGLSRQRLRSALNDRGVRTNESADVLLHSELFDHQAVESIHVVQRTVEQMRLRRRASLTSIFARAHELGLSMCPVITGPYLRLVMWDQESAPDLEMSTGRAPTGSLTVASTPLERDGFPTGFYLRVIDGVLWLRGYHTTDEHTWSPEDCFIFRGEPSP